ncbi:MAG: cysteine hydrolase family protein [Caldilineaceae bacterium]
MSKQALLIIDVQNCMFEPTEPVHNADQLLMRLRHLIAQARAAQTPVIYVQHCGPAGAPHEPGAPGWQIHPAIAPQAGELIVQKRMPDSFYETTLKAELNARDIKQLIMVGIQTEYCVDTTCRRAASEGYEVTLVRDAHSTWSKEDLTAEQIIAHHNWVLGDWFAKLVSTADVQF